MGSNISRGGQRRRPAQRSAGYGQQRGAGSSYQRSAYAKTTRRRRFRFTGGTLAALLVLVAIIAGGVFVGKLLASSPALDEMRAYLTNYQYQQAHNLYAEQTERLQGVSATRFEKQANQLLSQEVGRFSALCAQGDWGATGPMMVGIRVFEKQITEQVNALIAENTQSYIARTKLYEQFTLYLDRVELLEFTKPLVDVNRDEGQKYYESRQAFERAQAAEQDGKPIEAMADYAKVIGQDADDYAKAQERMGVLGPQVKSEIFGQADQISGQGRYLEAIELLEGAIAMMPEDAELTAKLDQVRADYQRYEGELVSYKGPVEHLFTHALIAYPEICYSSPAMMASLDTDCVTAYEYKKVLEALYANNYILIDINMMVTKDDQGRPMPVTELMLPKGKKPLIWSFDDVVYDRRKMGTGMVDKIILDDNGNIATYTKHADGSEEIRYDNEVITVLDQFVKDHPDFSFRGAKGTLALTGFEGILGYRTQADEPNRQSEIEAVKPIIARLKETGWNFACHGYGHRRSNQVSYDTMVSDARKWNDEVASLLGDTQIYIWPFGEQIPYNDPKFEMLRGYGFTVFSTVDSTNAVWWRTGDKLGIINGRRNIDGYALRNFRDRYVNAGLFDAKDVFDPVRPNNPYR